MARRPKQVPVDTTAQEQQEKKFGQVLQSLYKGLKSKFATRSEITKVNERLAALEEIPFVDSAEAFEKATANFLKDLKKEEE